MKRSFLAAFAFRWVGLAGIAISTGSAEAAPCPPGQRRECRPQKEPQKPGATPACRCVAEPTSGQGSSGKAEIKRKNVPQLKANKAPTD